MYDFEFGYEEEQEVKMTKEFREREERIKSLCEQNPHFKRLPYGTYILPYYDHFGISVPPHRASRHYRSYYLYTNFPKPNPDFYVYADIYYEHKKTYDGARRVQGKILVDEDRRRDKLRRLNNCEGMSADYF